MYEAFYGLSEKPFDLHPDPDYFYLSHGHENAFTHLEYAIAENKGFVIVTGEIGSGKTTLINFLLTKIRQDVQVGLISNTSLPPDQFMKMICQEFELEVEGADRAGMLDILHGFLLKQFSEKRRVILIIDEAQNLLPTTMEEIRMLSNLESEKHHLIQIILVGQPELQNKLQREDLKQFTQRVTVHCHLSGLKREEVDKCIRYRLKVAGAQGSNIFNDEAIEAVYQYSRGIPRLINILCDTALVYGYADGLKTIDEGVIRRVIEAREPMGVISDAGAGEEEAPPPSPTIAATPSESFQKQFHLFERRLLLLEDRIAGMDRRLGSLNNGKDPRDTIILELFRVVKESMESRKRLILKVVQYRKKVEASYEPAPKEEKVTLLSPFYRLKRGKPIKRRQKNGP